MTSIGSGSTKVPQITDFDGSNLNSVSNILNLDWEKRSQVSRITHLDGETLNEVPNIINKMRVTSDAP